MAYFLYKLKFNTPVHFGSSRGTGLAETLDDFSSDKFFSALCIECLKLHGEEEVNEFLQYAQRDTFALSNLMPYYDETVYMPKPFAWVERKQKELESGVDRKAEKKIKYVNIEEINGYFKKLHDGVLAETQPSFGASATRTSINMRQEEDAKPFALDCFSYGENSGLAFILQCDESKQEYMDDMIESLGYTGIGGRKSSGFGKYEIADVEDIDGTSRTALYKLLTANEAHYTSVSDIIPTSDDMKKIEQGDSCYSIVRRGGFVSSEKYAPTLVKKNAVGVLCAGSCFSDRITGSICCVGNNGSHKVYRYGKAMLLGVQYE